MLTSTTDNADLVFDEEQLNRLKNLKQKENKELKVSNEWQKEKKKTSGFGAFNLSEFLIKAIRTKGYNIPTPIQRKAIPQIIEGHNIIAMARTGSGKTGAFVIPLIERLQSHSSIVGARAVILSPTREIAVQTALYFKRMAKETDLTYVLITGGNDMENQYERLLLNPDVIIATPGRLMHCIQESNLSLAQCQLVVYDEADRLFELGFAEQIKAITDRMTKNKQQLLFSATISGQVQDFALTGIRDYKMVQVDKDSKLSDLLQIHAFKVKNMDKQALLLFLLSDIIGEEKTEQSIIFGATKYDVEYLYELLNCAGFKTTYIFGSMDQRSRELNLNLFRAKKVQHLIVTDLAARGLDIPLLNNVIHYDFPPKMKLFIHRSGRTARAGKKGNCFVLLPPEEIAYLADLSVFVGRKYSNQIKQDQKPDDPNTIYWGTVPQSILDSYNQSFAKISERMKTAEDLLKSIKLSRIKYNKTRDPASAASMTLSKDFYSEQKTHPLLLPFQEEQNEDLNNLKAQLSNFKPKQSLLEYQIEVSKDTERQQKYEEVKKRQLQKLNEKLEAQKLKKSAEKAFEKERQYLEKQLITRKKVEIEHERKLEEETMRTAGTAMGGGKMSKKARQKIDKIRRNQEMNSEERDVQIQKLEEEIMENKRQKRSQQQDFKKKEQFIGYEKGEEGENQIASTWRDDEKAILQDVQVSMLADDGEALLKNKKVMKWDSTKKRYQLKKVDAQGQVVKEGRNEAGKKIKDGKKQKESAYAKWQKRTHLKLQEVGEVENKGALEQGRVASESRKMLKHFKSKHKDINKGEDPRSNAAVFEAKAKKLQQKRKGQPRQERSRGGYVGDKQKAKIEGRTARSRSIMITRKKR